MNNYHTEVNVHWTPEQLIAFVYSVFNLEEKKNIQLEHSFLLIAHGSCLE